MRSAVQPGGCGAGAILSATACPGALPRLQAAPGAPHRAGPAALLLRLPDASLQPTVPLQRVLSTFSCSKEAQREIQGLPVHSWSTSRRPKSTAKQTHRMGVPRQSWLLPVPAQDCVKLREWSEAVARRPSVQGTCVSPKPDMTYQEYLVRTALPTPTPSRAHVFARMCMRMLGFCDWTHPPAAAFCRACRAECGCSCTASEREK